LILLLRMFSWRFNKRSERGMSALQQPGQGRDQPEHESQAADEDEQREGPVGDGTDEPKEEPMPRKRASKPRTISGRRRAVGPGADWNCAVRRQVPQVTVGLLALIAS
jgi:hypothetical protein